MTLTIVSIGPGDPSLLNAITIQTLRDAGKLILRTCRHPIAAWLDGQGILYSSLDDLYDNADDFDMLSEAVARTVWEASENNNETVYAVSDTMTDHTIDIIFDRRPQNGKISMIPGFSFADYYLPSCREYFPTADVRICPASSFGESGYDPEKPILITELNDGITAGNVKSILSSYIHDEEKVIFLKGDATAFPVPLYELDRQLCYDHLSAVAAGPFSYSKRTRKTLGDLMRIMDHLRSEEGCPWDRVQTHDSLKPYVVEEAWEVVDAIQQKDPVHLAEELGDLLFQVVFHTSIGKTFDEFTMTDVIGNICDKMIRRHPHVFSKNSSNKVAGSDPAFINETWDKIKQSETGSETPAETLNDVSAALPSLRYAGKILRKLSLIPGFSYSSSGEIKSYICNKAACLSNTDNDEEIQKHLGSLLFCCAELARQLNLDSEVLLHQAVRRVIDRCQTLENESKNASDNRKPLTFNDLGVY